MSDRSSVRAAAARLLDRALASRQPLDGLLAPALADRPARDRALLRSLVLGSLRWLRRLDAALAAASSRPLERIDPELLAPLRVAAFQLLCLDRVPAHAAVKEAVDEARRRSHRGGAGFVNAVLRRLAARPRLEDWPVEEGDPVRRLAVETSHPDFLVERWLARFGEPETRRLLAANNRPKPLQLLAFRDRGGPAALAAALAEEGIATAPAELSPLALTVTGGDPLASAAFRRGELYVQDDASQAAALVPPPAAGETVLDAAAAPGGKSLALVAWEPSVRPVLAELSPARLGRLRRNLRRLGRPLPLVVADARRPALAGGFHRVVADLPCSGTGTLRRHPELKWRLSPEEIGRLAEQATAMLDALAGQLAPGGLLVAITCSLEAEENEAVVAELVARRPELEPVDLAPVLPSELAAHVFARGGWRLMPTAKRDGFTVHVLRRHPLPS